MSRWWLYCVGYARFNKHHSASAPRTASLVSASGYSLVHPALPLRFALAADTETTRAAHERLYQQKRFINEYVEPSVGTVSRRPQPEVKEPTARAIDKRVDAELLDEALELATGGRAFGKVDEMNRDPSLGKETLSFACGSTLFAAEDLNGHRYTGR
jgi:hypothetical protein